MRTRGVSSVAPPVVLGVFVLLAWQSVVGLAHLPGYIVPSPIAIADEIHDSFPVLAAGSVVSGTNALTGLLAGAVLAVLMALITSKWRLLDGVFGSLSAGAAAVPIVALAPLCYGAFSATSEFPRRLVVTVLVFFPLYINLSKGLKQIMPLHQELMHACAASGWQLARFVQIPTVMPFLFSGLRIAAPGAVITAIISEYFGGGQNGLASLIVNAAGNSAYAQAWAYVSASVFLGLVAFVVSVSLESWVDRRLGAHPG